LYDNYRKALKALLSDSTLQQIFGGLSQKFFVVSAPLIENENILLHLVLGHEIGHRIADAFLDTEDQSKLLVSVTTRIGDGKWFDPDIEEQGPLFAIKKRQRLISAVLEIRRRGLEEIISDLSGLYLFGPAFLFALNEFAYEDVLDDLPSLDQYYPPWRYRYRECIKVFDETNASRLGTFLGNEVPGPQVKESFEARIDYLKAITRNEEDLKAIAGDQIMKRAYEEIESTLPRAPSFILEQLGSLVYSLDSAKGDFPVLLQRLATGVPPNEGPKGTSDCRSAFTIGWLVRLAKIPIPFDPGSTWKHEHHLALNRLVHKAVEYTEISRDYNIWKAGGTT
jgi:hypothetical protein